MKFWVLQYFLLFDKNAKYEIEIIKKWFTYLFIGTVEGDCKFQTANSYGFCDCVELVPDYYDEDFIGIYQVLYS